MTVPARRMRVLLLSRDRNGLDTHSLTASRWKKLAEQGMELEVWVLSPQQTEWSFQNIHVFGTGGRTIFQRLGRLLSRRPMIVPDLISAQDPAEIGYIASRLARRWSTKFEVQDHGSWFDGSGTLDEPFWCLRFSLARWLVRRAASVRSVNPLSVAWLASHIKGLAYWLPIVPSAEFRTLKHQPVAGRIVCVARLVSVKRHGLLLEAFACLHKIRPDVRLILVGDGPERSFLECRINELGLREFVQLVGTAPAAPFVASADVFVLLSSHEGWGVAAVEAALVGVPVVMSDTGAARWLAERGAAKIVQTNNPDQIAQMIDEELGKSLTPLQEVMNADEAAAEQVRIWQHIISL